MRSPYESSTVQPANAIVEKLVVGSSVNCDVIIKDSSVSPQHLTISKLNKLQFLIEDLQSKEGTFVKGQRIQKATVTKDDIIQIGFRPIDVFSLSKNFSSQTPLLSSAGASLLIGSAEPCDIILPFPDISPMHAELMVEKNGNIMIADKGSTKGTTVNRHHVTSMMQVSAKDEVYLGSYKVQQHTWEKWIEQLEMMGDLFDSTVEATDTEVMHETTQTLDSASFAQQNSVQNPNNVAKVQMPKEGTLSIGRDPESNIVLNHPSVSWKHAKLVVRNDVWTLFDLNSANGIFVDGLKITKAEVNPKSWIRVGGVFLYLEDGSVSTKSLEDDAMRLDVTHLGKKLPSGKTLLDDISFSVYPGEVVALMGPSGAGKTALLECLTGQRIPTKGKIYLNGRSLHKYWDSFRHSIGYVPQEDVMHRDLTVYETLYFAAKMRLPKDLPESAIVETVDSIMMRMGLANIRDSIIGDERVRGISGGQRKRVNIALELLTEPSLLFLDEPTSGLDGTSTLEILQILRSLANSGKTIILTIHQPRIEAYQLVDNLLLLVQGGRLVYYGPAKEGPYYFSNYAPKNMYKDNMNPADYIIDMLESSKANDQQFTIDWQKEFQQSSLCKRFVVNRSIERKEMQIEEETSQLQQKVVGSQFLNLFSRYTKRKLRDTSSLFIQLLQTPVIGGILAWLFWQEGFAMATKEEIKAFNHRGLLNMIQLNNGIHATLFLIGAAAFWFGCSNVAREIVSDRSIYLRERRKGMRSIAYLGAIFSYQFVLSSVQTLLITMIVWPSLAFTANFFLYWCVLQVIASCGISLGLLVSAYSKTEVTAISVVPLLLLPQLMLGGFIKLYGELQTNSFQGFLSDLMPIRWAFESLSVLEYSSLQASNEFVRDLREVVGFTSMGFWKPTLVLLGYIVVFLAFTLMKQESLEHDSL